MLYKKLLPLIQAALCVLLAVMLSDATIGIYNQRGSITPEMLSELYAQAAEK